jgi:hypothetical protein
MTTKEVFARLLMMFYFIRMKNKEKKIRKRKKRILNATYREEGFWCSVGDDGGDEKKRKWTEVEI